MGLEPISVGFFICSALLILGWIASYILNWISDYDDNFGSFTVMCFALIGLGISLTYIYYMRGV